MARHYGVHSREEERNLRAQLAAMLFTPDLVLMSGTTMTTFCTQDSRVTQYNSL